MASASAPVALDDTVDKLSGAGQVTAQRLSLRGLTHVRDLLYFFPQAYEDYRRIYGVGELVHLPQGTSVVVRGTVVRVHKFFRRLLDVYLEENGGKLRARWFHPNAGMAKMYARGETVAWAGKLRRTPEGRIELIHPSNVTTLLAEADSVGIRPRYATIEKVPGRTLEKIVGAAVSAAGDEIPDALPEALRARLGLPGLAQALRFLHQPPPSIGEGELAELLAGRSPAQRRFAFEELLVLQVGLARERRRTKTERAWRCRDERSRILSDVEAALPFALTSAQDRAIATIFDDLDGESPMQRLLQGDVGSGKTAVAFATCVRIARAGGQILFMAPTAVLAEQHFRTLGDWGKNANVRVGLLHSALPTSVQRRVLDAAAEGEMDLVVGTHALLEDRLRLPRLALAIVDEQHRFGVRQRARLRCFETGENGWQTRGQNGIVPHLLVLSATPIPRTLALTLYGDLDLVTLDELPPGRKPVITRVCADASARVLAYAAVKEAVAAGGQAFVVCPAINEHSGTLRPPTAVKSLARALRAKLAPARMGVLHGQLSGDEQQATIEAFHAGALDVLVATTVLEVGVDVPRASVMVIEDADRFGLAQLHQLRGRVGRGHEQAYCFLLTGATEVEALERLEVLATVHDGFRIAEEDLRRRGAGDLRGTRQTGVPELRFADLASYAGLVELAHEAADQIVAIDPGLSQPEHRELRRAVVKRWQQARPIAEEAG